MQYFNTSSKQSFQNSNEKCEYVNFVWKCLGNQKSHNYNEEIIHLFSEMIANNTFYTYYKKKMQIQTECDERLVLILRNDQGQRMYRKTSIISRTKSQNLNVSCILLQLSSLNPPKPCVKLKMKM